MELVLTEVARTVHPERRYTIETFRLLGKRHGLGLLESALAEPRQGFQGRYLYRTVFDKAAALFRSLLLDHPLQEGNMRLAVAATGVFLLLNGYLLCVPTSEVVRFTMDVASRGSDVSWRDVSRWLRRSCVPVAALLDEEHRARLELPDPGAISAILPALEALHRR